MSYTVLPAADNSGVYYNAARDQHIQQGVADAHAAIDLLDASASRYVAPGVHVADDSALSRWRAARNASGTARADVLIFGDSTSHGQTPAAGGDTASEANRPIAQMLRAKAVAAGYADGGVGLRGWAASAGMSGGDAQANVVSSTGGVWTSGLSGFYGGLFNNSLATTTGTGTNGATLTIQGKGQRLRISEVTNVTNYGTATGYASWTYSIDGGAAVTPAAPTGTGGRRVRTLDIDLGGSAGASHTVIITLTSDGLFEMVNAWVNTTGVAFHTLALSGQQLNGRFDSTSGSIIQTAPFFGIGNNAVVSEVLASATAVGGPWAPALAVVIMGVNEQILGSADQATALTSSAKMRQGVGYFAELCRMVGIDGLICIPQFAFATNARQYQGLYRSSLYSAARSFGLAVADLQVPLGGVKSALNVGVHLTEAGYQAQADWLWNNVLSL